MLPILYDIFLGTDSAKPNWRVSKSLFGARARPETSSLAADTWMPGSYLWQATKARLYMGWHYVVMQLQGQKRKNAGLCLKFWPFLTHLHTLFGLILTQSVELGSETLSYVLAHMILTSRWQEYNLLWCFWGQNSQPTGILTKIPTTNP